jgi:hypothetical protein
MLKKIHNSGDIELDATRARLLASCSLVGRETFNDTENFMVYRGWCLPFGHPDDAEKRLR